MPAPAPRFTRGSEWRKWDLQVHTPFSELNNGFGSDFDEYAKQLLTTAVQKEIAVVGITDYFCIEGYKRLRALMANQAELEALVGAEVATKAKGILFVPNIELRTSILLQEQDGKQSRVNFHVIFSDALSPEEIEEHFLRELKFTAESAPDDKDERWSLTLPNLQALGKKLQAQHAKFRDKSELFTGMMNAVVQHEEVTSVLLERGSMFKDRICFFLPCDEDLSKFKWDGQGHHMRKGLYHKAHVLFSSNPSTRKFALGQLHTSMEEYIAEFKAVKPCFHSSDAHTYAELFAPQKNRHTWVKADPTFRGLRQTFSEPEDRVYIGDLPPALDRVAKHPTKVISSLEVRKLPTSTIPDVWFDSELPLNPELIAIIGNKGAGKSALSDIIGLLGNTPRYTAFSFLHPRKFRDSKIGKAHHYRAKLVWADTTDTEVKNLATDPAPGSVEKVKYIPQSYLEEICNEVGQGKGSKFYSELEEVIFSHVPHADKVGFATLSELLTERSEEIETAVGFLAEEVTDVNAKIIACEEKLSPQHRASIQAQLAEKNRELEAHVLNRPKDRQKPDEDPEFLLKSKAVSEALDGTNGEMEKLEAEIAETKERDAALAKKKLNAEKLLAKLENFQRQATTFLTDTLPDFEELGLVQKDMVSVSVETKALVSLIAEFGMQRTTVATALNPLTEGGLEKRRSDTEKKIAELQTQLSAPQREYQAYLQSLKEWETARAAIIGDASVNGSIVQLNAQLDALLLLPAEVEALKKIRQRKSLAIFAEKTKLRSFYSSYYGEVQNFLAQHPLAKSGNFKLTFDVTITENGFAEGFLGRINRRKMGAFMGEEEGNAEIKKLLEATDFDSPRSTLRFGQKLISLLEGDGNRKLEPKEQLRGGFTLQDLYDYIFSLSYVSPIYNLKWDGKALDQLSPGERGNLLLIFYLLVDRDDLPLVIDQPEENLDNQTVFKTLVPCIKDAKTRRQIIIVTHNPNLAVVCDAEQIICAEIDKEHGNAVSYLTGSIEDPAVNQKIVDILEGTRPAFDKRDDKYQP